MIKSETIGKIALSLAKAQAEIRNAVKNKENPFFKSSYADLAEVWDVCREPLSKNEIAVSQLPGFNDKGDLVLTTLLMHSSGEFLGSELPIKPIKPDPQSTGSSITYMRRFALAAMVGIASAEDDDDGNKASGSNETPQDTNKNIARSDQNKTTAPTPLPKPKQSAMGDIPEIREFGSKVFKKLQGIPPNEVMVYLKTQFKTEDFRTLTLENWKVLDAWIHARSKPIQVDPQFEQELRNMPDPRQMK